MFFIILKGALGREVFLTDREGRDGVIVSQKQGENYGFIAFDPNHMSQFRHVFRKYGSVHGVEIIPAKLQ